MKVAIFFALMLFASSYAFTPFLFEEGHKFLDFLKDHDHRCFVLLFKNSNAADRRVEQATLDERNSAQQSALESQLDGQENVSYAVVDVGSSDLNDDTKADIEEFLKESRIDIRDLDSYPVIAVLDDGVGAYIWGPRQELVIDRLIDSFRHGRLGNPHN